MVQLQQNSKSQKLNQITAARFQLSTSLVQMKKLIMRHYKTVFFHRIYYLGVETKAVCTYPDNKKEVGDNIPTSQFEEQLGRFPLALCSVLCTAYTRTQNLLVSCITHLGHKGRFQHLFVDQPQDNVCDLRFIYL